MKYFVFVVILLFGSFCLAQTSPTESNSEKEKKQKELEQRVLQMLDQAVAEAETLQLAQNRAIVYGVAGDLYWKFDETRARNLFRNAANELIVVNAEIEKEKKEEDDPFYAVYDFDSNVRSDILPLIAKHDADLALKMLVETRPAQLAAELAKSLQPNAKETEDGIYNFSPEKYRVQQEVALEQQFAVLAAEQNPDLAIKLIKDSLAKGISWNVLPLLQKLNKKSEKKASEAADEVVKKILDTDLTKKKDDLDAAVRFLQYATNPNAEKNPKEKPFKFSEAQLKDIANKLADTFLQPTNSLTITMSMIRVIPSLEKLTPQKVPLLKQKQTEAMKNLPPELQSMEQQQKIWNPNSTPEEIIADLPKLNGYSKASAYQSLSRKISTIEDESRAKKLIEQIPDEQARTNATERYEAGKIKRAATAGKLDEAKNLIKNLGKRKTQIEQLVGLALEFQKKETEEDQKTALSLMKDAQNLATQYPQDEEELNDAMELVKGYSVINPAEAFRIFEPIIDQMNEYIQASSVLSKFNKRNQNFKKGELAMKVNGYSWDGLLLFRYIDKIQGLGKADLNKMNLYADRFARNDVRTIVKLFIAQGFLKEEKDKNSNTSEGEIFIVN